MDEMKPCPFCGRQGRIKKYSDDRYRAVCENHLCPVESFDYHAEQEAKDWWNKRHDPEHDRWISVEERLPTIASTVIVAGKMKYRFEAEYTTFVDVATYTLEECFETFNDWYEGQDEFCITHWMPLPEPPKEEHDG